MRGRSGRDSVLLVFDKWRAVVLWADREGGPEPAMLILSLTATRVYLRVPSGRHYRTTLLVSSSDLIVYCSV